MGNAVKSEELKWLPNGSEFVLATETSTSNLTSKPKTYTSFTCSQESMPEFRGKAIAPFHSDITIAKIGPGQVMVHFSDVCWSLVITFLNFPPSRN